MEGKKPKILLCEDDPNLGSVLKNYLELNDYDVTLERDGRLGLAAFQREKFELCLLDVMMPNMDGFTLAEEIRDVDPDIPLFFLSAKTMKDDIIQGYKLGGLYLPPGVQEKEKVQQGYVIKTGPGYAIPMPVEDEAWKGEEEQVKYVPLQAKEGDLAIFLLSGATEVIYENEKYFIVPQSAVLMLEREEDL